MRVASVHCSVLSCKSIRTGVKCSLNPRLTFLSVLVLANQGLYLLWRKGGRSSLILGYLGMLGGGCVCMCIWLSQVTQAVYVCVYVHMCKLMNCRGGFMPV